MSASQYPVSHVQWGDFTIPYADALDRATEAELIATGFRLTMRVVRTVDGVPTLETIIDYFELARLIEKVMEVAKWTQ
ncbi:hypothetical protein QFZ83_002173 [Variovorax sp. W1I1]|uniref:hypothetical protein n=1 Tax=Variovorax sp. W1I1 TaxID=3042309 RepID=UPI0027867778|nr:hypothetical protein [Variovorax sp. W1I1]MDQ0608002.1 hypothetical protein [Variovorax sp. W1I1]